ncbi:MAG: iron-containing alcohol dehydrogenase [Bdellovibrionota bacterium]
MKQFNYPTTVYYGPGSLQAMAKSIAKFNLKKLLLVSDPTLLKLGLVKQVADICAAEGIKTVAFCDVHPNPIEEDVLNGIKIYKKENCDGFIALGGGSPMDAAKGIMILVDHSEPLAQYDDTKGGDRLITKDLPPLFAIATTAGTGSEVGRSSVIIIKATNDKTILFHPTMMPKIAVLEPALTTSLPQSITVATGLDAFTHNLEAFLAPGFHPMADGIALQGIELILENLPIVYKAGDNLEARGKMLMASTMGATAFQKGLGMIHSMAHPLSSECGLHHGLANALALPSCLEFIEKADLSQQQRARLDKVQQLFKERGLAKTSLSQTCTAFFKELGLVFGLKNHGVKKEQLMTLSHKAFLDPCHANNIIPVTEKDFKEVFEKAYG